ncbi:MAG: polysaccharide deacetylase family protein [Chloroflexi bacterium]|nr:polysaccharide deacetylase family protein [Chloroflexota bacterium]
MLRKQGLVNLTLNALVESGAFRAMRQISPPTLTVLNYHRIADSADPTFTLFKPIVSATPEQFARQMDYVKDVYNVIDTKQLAAWLHGGGELPPNPAIITFDDGYYDNLSNAYPILKERGLTAIIFLATSYIGSVNPFYWDLAAYAFYHTKKDCVQTLSNLICWSDQISRDKAVNTWVVSVKKLLDEEKQRQLDILIHDLDVAIPENAFHGLHLSWEQARSMTDGVIEFGAHTVTHPILTRVTFEQAAWEIFESKRRIEEEIGKPVNAFAYPNGGHADYSEAVCDLVRNSGCDMAFTLMPGPVSLGRVKKRPFEIPRVFLGDWDSFPRFVAKLSGAEVIREKISSIRKKSK